MQDNFVHRERLKRVEHAQALLQKGKPLHEIAHLLGVQEKTIKGYLEYACKKETKQQSPLSLAQFMTQKTTLDTLFPSALQEGFRCVRCKRYAKQEAGIVWENNAFMCRGCYLGLTSREVASFVRTSLPAHEGNQ